MKRDGHKILTNTQAKSADSALPTFLARPDGAPVYHGFPLIPETMTDGWCLGAITHFEYPEGCVAGDAFVMAPDGSRAGLVWDVGSRPLAQIMAPDEGRWGVYQVSFPKAVHTRDDLVFCFRAILPELKAAHEKAFRVAKPK
jgi:hypothetical protein